MTQSILIAGATGKTGQHLTRFLAETHHDPIALVRDGSDTSSLPEGTAQRTGDLTDLPDDVCAGVDTVVFAAGSGGGTSAEMTDKVDRDGAQRLIDIAAKSGVSRFVMPSSIGADQSEPEGDLAHYLKAKHDADEHLKQSGLTWAILRPVALTDDGPSTDVVLGDDVDPKAKAARTDVARQLAEAATTGHLDGRAVNMQSA